MQALIIRQGAEVGCDVEQRDSSVRGRQIAQRYFSDSEVEELFQHSAADQAHAFFDYWSLKESFIKAKGLGLALPLGSFSFSIQQRPIAFATDDSLNETPEDWFFQLLDVGDAHAAAYAVEGLEKPVLSGWAYHVSGELSEIKLQPR